MLNLTEDTLLEIAKLSPKDQKLLMAKVGQHEFDHCASDIFYWLDASRHCKTDKFPEGLPYVFTNDPHAMYRCRKCNSTVNQYKRRVHIEVFHPEQLAANAGDLTELQYRVFFEALSPTRPFTIMPYMPPIIEWWIKKPLMAIEKSRDMMMTWLIVTLYTWDTLFHQGRQNIFQSEDSAKTRELVQRAAFIYANQPPFLKSVHRAVATAGASRSGELKVPSLNSEILGFPQGANQIRQFHPSGVFTDETAFQVQAVDSFAAIKPAIQNGGRYTGVSSANPGWFQFICEDRLADL